MHCSQLIWKVGRVILSHTNIIFSTINDKSREYMYSMVLAIAPRYAFIFFKSMLLYVFICMRCLWAKLCNWNFWFTSPISILSSFRLVDACYVCSIVMLWELWEIEWFYYYKKSKINFIESTLNLMRFSLSIFLLMTE